MNNKLSPQTVDKIREILRANPGKTLQGSFVDGRSHYKLVPAVGETRRRRLKLLKASDQATDVEIQSADSIENAAVQTAPGSAPFLTATAIVSGINSQALTQKMLAAELRQEAARLAHRNTLRKENANKTTQLRGVLVNLLQHQ